MEQATSSSYHHQGNGQGEVCIKLIKYTIKKCTDTKSDIHIALLQIRVFPIESGLQRPTTLLFNHLI